MNKGLWVNANGRYLESSVLKVSLFVTDKDPMWQRPVSSTVGRLPAPLTALMLGTTAPFRESSTLDDAAIRKIIQQAKKNKKLKDVHVALGSGHPWAQLKRIWENKHISIPTKVWGTAMHPLSALNAALHRGDHYDPFSNTVVNYIKDPAILAHELGHAEDFANQTNPGVYILSRMNPVTMLNQEFIASSNAATLLDKINKRQKLKNRLKQLIRLNRVLGGGLGSYGGVVIGNALATISPEFRKLLSSHRGMNFIPPVAGALIGQAVGARFLPIGGRVLKRKLEQEDIGA